MVELNGTIPDWVFSGSRDGVGDGSGDGYGYGSGHGYGYDAGDGYGYCYGSGDGYGYGYGPGSGFGDGYGVGDGYGDVYVDGYGYGYVVGVDSSSGSGDGYGIGSGVGYGIGYGIGSGSGDGYGSSYWFHVAQESVGDSMPDCDVLAFWWSGANGEPTNGGVRTEAARVGLRQMVKGPLSICHNGLHATMEPEKWKGDRLWIVALRGEWQRQRDKFAALDREIIAEVKL